ncbi:MAG TPA: 50S ribosomal protein L18Ae [Candidatus Bathyarchaeia archaeon]|nr:50S ribosomal protein L18Ae [Candidatus Bathyarchaeia archaeon]
MSEVKVFRVVGKITKPNYKTDFRKEIRALKPEEAVERVYMEIGSKHRAKRVHIKVLKVEEISAEEVTDASVRKLILGENESVQ